MIAGKQYKHNSQHFNTVYDCLFATKQIAVMFNTATKQEFALHYDSFHCYHEYKPPVIHKRKIAVFRNKSGFITFSSVRSLEHKWCFSGGQPLKEIEIEYVENE